MLLSEDLCNALIVFHVSTGGKPDKHDIPCLTPWHAQRQSSAGVCLEKSSKLTMTLFYAYMAEI